jgi:peptide/nickel transport system permease protein
MARYVVNRLAQAIMLLVIVSAIGFALLHLAPGGPLSQFAASAQMTQEDLDRVTKQLGLDRPLPIQYLDWFGRMLTGDWGKSYRDGEAVLSVISSHLGATLELMATATIIAVLLGCWIGILGALRRYSLFDTLATVGAMIALSIPTFWFGLVTIYVFSVKLGWLPAGGQADIRPDTPWLSGLGDRLRYLVLPATTLVLVQVGGYTRFMRGAMIEVLRQDYIRTARAKGLPENRVRWGHAFGNALAPVLTILALSFGGLFSGALITETMFAWPGMGKAIYQAILDNDYNLALVGLLITTFATIVGNLLADLALVAVDPRVTLASRLR